MLEKVLFFSFTVKEERAKQCLGKVYAGRPDFSYLAGMSPYISLKIKKRHYEHHMIEAHK
jgi:hypothetical protein